MSGLYQRALAYIRSQRELTPPEAPALERDQNVSAEERQRVLAQIEEDLARNKIQVTPDTLHFTPKQSGGVLPILINAGAVVVLIGGILAAVLLFRRQEQTIVAAPAALETAEGRLIQTLREESQRELTQKQKQIDDIQSRLQRISQEKAQMQDQLDERLRSRELELRDALNRELEQERSRLQGAGLSEERVATQLRQLENERTRSLESQMASFRSELETELQQREAALNQLTREYEQNLGQAREESARLEQEMASRQAELEAHYREQETALEADRARALEQLQTLREQQEKEQLVRDQFLSFYAATRDHLANGRFAEALAALAEFRRYLDQPGVSVLPAIRRRRPVELFLIDSLERLVKQEQESASANTESLIASANLLARVSEIVERADRLFQDREYQSARELYLSAVAQIPAVEVGYERLQQIEGIFAQRKDQEVAGLIAGAGGAYRRGDYEAAVNGYTRALTILQGQRGTVEEMIARIMDSGYRIRSAAVQAEAGTTAAGGGAAELEAARRRIAELEAAQTEAGQRLTELEAARRRITELEAARGAAEQRVSELEASVQRLTAGQASRVEMAEMAAQLESARGRIAALEAERTDAERRLAELERLRLDARQRGEELDAARKQIAELEAARAAAERRATDLETARAAAMQRASDLEAARAAAVQRAAESDTARAAAERRAADLEAQDAEARKRLSVLEAQRKEREAAAAELERIRRQYLALSAGGGAAEGGPTAELVTLLETKVLIQRVLISEPVRSEYPELYDRFERYLEALVDEQERATRVAVLRDVESILDSLNREQGKQLPAASLQPYRSAPASQPFLRVLDKLELLLR